MCFEFRAPNNDYSSNKLQSVKDEVFINLFDENLVDLAQVYKPSKISFYFM